MPVKRRGVKRHKHKITDEAFAMWASGHKEMICSTTKGGAGVVAHEALADALGLTAFIVFPGMARHPLEGGPACVPWLLERGGWAQ
jgi:hypothetical protein